MTASSSKRRKTAFVPWLAALLLGATAHMGWLVNKLEEPREAAAELPPRSLDVNINVNVDVAVDPGGRWGAAEAEAEAQDLDLWIHSVGRYTFNVDRRALERVAVAELGGWSDANMARLDARSRQIGLAAPIELRNIRAGTPLFLLGLRTGDRVTSLETEVEMPTGAEADPAISLFAGASLARVYVALERRGRSITLVYHVV